MNTVTRKELHVTTVDTKTGEEQVWHAHLADCDLYSTAQLVGGSLYKIESALKTLGNLDESSLRFYPLQEDTYNGNRTNYRGYVSSNAKDNDDNPFVVRGKAMPELELRIYKHCKDIRVTPSGYDVRMTDCQRKEIAERHGKQIRVHAFHPTTLATLKRYSKDYILSYCKLGIEQMRKDLEEIEAL
jgi:hypothetical protein